MRCRGALSSVVLALVGAGTAHARNYDNLGALEREAVDQALLLRGLHLEPAPDGKPIGTVHVVNHEVFSPRDHYFQLLNVFHRTTREPIIRRELLLRPGDPYQEALVQETTRNLRDADFSSLVAILPVKSSQPGQVDLLVVTRDVWSLRFNTEFEYQQGTLVYLTTSLSENNLLGWRKKFAMAFNLYRGTMATGPTYVDPNIAGTRLTFSASYRGWFDRETGGHEGDSARAVLSYPLYSLASRWGATIDVGHENRVFRDFLREQIRLVDLKSTPQVEMLPRIYRARSSGVVTSGTRSFPGKVIHRVTVGHSFNVRRTSLLPDYPEQDPALRQAFLREWAGASERVSALYARYGLFTPRFRVYRDLDTYDLREDATLGPSLDLSVSRAAGWLGSENTFVGLSGSAGWAFDLGEGFQRVSVSASGRVQGGELTDRALAGGLYLSSPVLWRTVRFLASAGTGQISNARRLVPYTLGGEDGLRGYGLGEFVGTTQFVAHAEARTRALSVGALRVGVLAFYDVGHAANGYVNLRPHHDAGVGVRILIPQLNYYVLRFDWAFPFQGTAFTRAGWPGRFSAGFRQVF